MESGFERLSRGDAVTAQLLSLLGGYSDSRETILDPVVRDATGNLPVLAVQRLDSGWRVFCEDTFLQDSKWVFSGIRMVARLLRIEAFRDAEIVVVSNDMDSRRALAWRQIAARTPCTRAVLFSLPFLKSDCTEFPAIADGIAAICSEVFRMPVEVTRGSVRGVVDAIKRDPVDFSNDHPMWGLTVLFYGAIWGEAYRRETGGVWHQPAGDARPEVLVGEMHYRPFEQIAQAFSRAFRAP